MVGARTVVTDATPKLGEDEEHNVVRTAVLLQVFHKGTNSARDLLPQLRMRGQLTRMGIKAAVLGVVNARAEIGTQHLSHTPKVLGDGIVRIRYSGGVLRGGGPEDVSTP